jgi:integrase
MLAFAVTTTQRSQHGNSDAMAGGWGTGKLKEAVVRATRQSERVVKLSDGGGLQLIIYPNGRKTWVVAFRWQKKQKKLTLGAWPGLSLAAARIARDKARQALGEGVNPAPTRKERAAIARAEDASRGKTFAEVGAVLLEEKRLSGVRAATMQKNAWLLRTFADAIGDLPVNEVKPQDVLAVVRRVDAAGRHETAKRLLAFAAEVFAVALSEQLITVNPAAGLRRRLLKVRPGQRAAITEPEAFGAMLRAIDGFQGQPTTVAALRLLAILFPRPGELRMAEWSEFDMDRAVWTIPAARMKMRQEHRIPLPRQAVAILAALKPYTGRQALVFPGIGSARDPATGRRVARPLSENTMNAALRRMGITAEEHCSHGFRVSARSMLARSGFWSEAAMEAQLAHDRVGDDHYGYQRSRLTDERRAMLQWWANQIDAMRAGVKELPRRVWGEEIDPAASGRPVG